MLPNKLLAVMVCCNEPDSGRFSGYLTGFDIGDLQVSYGLSEEGCWMLFEGNYLKVRNDQFYVADRRRWVGNWCWDGVTMPAESVCRLLNWAKKNDFFLDSAPTEFGEIWDSSKLFRLEHLDLLF